MPIESRFIKTTKRQILTTFIVGQLFFINTSQADEGIHWSNTIQGIFKKTNEEILDKGVGIEIGFDVLTFLALTFTFFGFFASSMKDRKLQRNRDIKGVNNIIVKCIKDVENCHQSNKNKIDKIQILNKVSTSLKLEVDNSLNFSLSQEHIQKIHTQVKQIRNLISNLRDHIYGNTVSSVATNNQNVSSDKKEELETKSTITENGDDEEVLTSELLFKLNLLNNNIKELDINSDYKYTYDCRLDNRDQFIINAKQKITNYGEIFTQTLQSYNLHLFAIFLITISISYYENQNFYQEIQGIIEIVGLEGLFTNPNEIFYMAIAVFAILWIVLSYYAKSLAKYFVLLGFGAIIFSALIKTGSTILSGFVVLGVIFVIYFFYNTRQKQKRNKIEKVFCLNGVITERDIYTDRESGEYIKVSYNKKGDTVKSILPHSFGVLFDEGIHFYTEDNLTKTKDNLTKTKELESAKGHISKNELLPFLKYLRNEDKLGSIRGRIHYTADLRHGIAETYREDTTLSPSS